MPDPRLAVAVVTRDRRDELLRTLDRLADLPEAPPVVVVDNASSDGTAAAVRARHPQVQLVEPGRNLGAVGRNLAATRVDPPYLAFCDDDTWWEPGALARAADVLDAHPRVAVVTGRILVEPGGREDPVNAELRDSPLPRDPTLPGFPLLSFLAGASVVRRSAFLEVGGFSERMFLGGEEELCASDLAAAGWRLCHLPDAVVHHAPSPARDPHRYRRTGIRNALWFWWLRRPAGAALRRSVHLLRTAPRDRHTVRAVLAALGGAAYVVRHRRVVPPDVERGYRLLDGPQTASRARRYVS